MRFAVFRFIARFGLIRGLEFRRVAAKCDRDPHLLREWETYYRAKASREFRHDNKADGRVFLAFAEMLSTTRERVIRKRKAVRRPLLTQQNRRIDRAVRRRTAV